LAGLLVSVRSAQEAEAALAGGAAVIDVKEPSRGPLGCADLRVWRAVRGAVPAHVPVSVALGELSDWPHRQRLPAAGYDGIAFRKLGLARTGQDWRNAWAGLRAADPHGPEWIAVAYADYKSAGAPDPEAVLEAAIAAGCAGILIDSWDKSQPSPIDASWSDYLCRARASGLTTALAGGLDERAILLLAALQPDFFAVRGAACRDCDRTAAIDQDRVARLALAAQGCSSEG
jgi:uncharacterized protein (UPF0264 family)